MEHKYIVLEFDKKDDFRCKVFYADNLAEAYNKVNKVDMVKRIIVKEVKAEVKEAK